MPAVEIGGIGVPAQGIYILDLQTEMLLPIPEYEGRPSNPDWTSDNNVLSFSRGGINGPEIVTLDLESDNLERVVGGSFPSWSPDGSYLAFVRAGEENFGASGQPSVFTLNLTTREQSLVFEGPEAEEATITGLSWSPNSNRLALSATWWTPDQSYTASLFIVSANGRDLQKLADDIWNPGWMPNGKWLYFLLPGGRLGFAPLDFKCMLTPLNITGLSDSILSPLGDQMALVHSDSIYLLDLEQIVGANREKLTCFEQ